MNKTQKSAVYGLVLTIFLLLIAGVDLIDTKVNPVLIRVVGYPLVIVFVVVPIYLIEKKNSHRVPLDERDKLIIKRAMPASCGLLACVGVVGYVILYFIVPGSKGVVPVSRLPEIVYFSAILFILSLSTGVLVQYGRGGRNGE